jgi:hypothetical protein
VTRIPLLLALSACALSPPVKAAERDEATRRTLAHVCRPGRGDLCPGRCLVPREGGIAGYCTQRCEDDASCPSGWTCTAAGKERLCARGPALDKDVVSQFHARFPGERAKLAEHWYRWYLKEKGAYQAELMAQIFAVAGLVAMPTEGRAWEEQFLEDVLFFVRLFPASFLGTRYSRLERHPISGGAGRTVQERNAIEIHDGNFGIHGTFLHELGHVLDDLRTGALNADPDWRRLHGWKRAPGTATGWSKRGRDCTNGYGVVYGVPGQEFADEQWNFIRYGCSFRRCDAGYYEYLKNRVYGGWCYCAEDASCKNANPF